MSGFDEIPDDAVAETTFRRWNRLQMLLLLGMIATPFAAVVDLLLGVVGLGLLAWAGLFVALVLAFARLIPYRDRSLAALRDRYLDEADGYRGAAAAAAERLDYETATEELLASAEPLRRAREAAGRMASTDDDPLADRGPDASTDEIEVPGAALAECSEVVRDAEDRIEAIESALGGDPDREAIERRIDALYDDYDEARSRYERHRDGPFETDELDARLDAVEATLSELDERAAVVRVAHRVERGDERRGDASDAVDRGAVDEAWSTYQAAQADYEAALATVEEYALGFDDRAGEALGIDPGIDDIDGVGPTRATNLREHGFESPRDVFEASLADLKAVPNVGHKTALRLRSERTSTPVAEELRSRIDAVDDALDGLGEVEDRLRGIEDLVADAETELDEARAAADRGDLDGAERRCEALVDEIDAALNADLPEIPRADELERRRAEAESLLATVRSERERRSVDERIEAAADDVARAETARESGDFGAAAAELDEAIEAYEAAVDLADEVAPDRIDDLRDERSAVEDRRDAVAADRAAAEVREITDDAERAAERGESSAGAGEHADAVAAFQTAVAGYEEARDVAEAHDLNSLWEVDQRLELLRSSLSDAEESRERRREAVETTLRRKLDRVEGALTEAEHRIDASDYEAARDRFGAASELLASTAETIDGESAVDEATFAERLSELEGREASVRERLDSVTDDDSASPDDSVQTVDESGGPAADGTGTEETATDSETETADGDDGLDDIERVTLEIAMMTLRSELGRPPTPAEVNERTEYGVAQYAAEFGSFEAALEAIGATPTGS